MLKLLNIQKGPLLGYTFIPSRIVFKQTESDLQEIAEEVDTHESVHQEKEYDTRIWTRFMIDESQMKDYAHRNNLRMYGNQKHMDN